MHAFDCPYCPRSAEVMAFILGEILPQGLLTLLFFAISWSGLDL